MSEWRFPSVEEIELVVQKPDFVEDGENGYAFVRGTFDDEVLVVIVRHTERAHKADKVGEVVTFRTMRDHEAAAWMLSHIGQSRRGYTAPHHRN